MGLAASGRGAVLTDRIPKLVGALNFRDLGGYPAANGRCVRWRMLYRSGTTHAMTAEDIAHLESRGIRYTYDLRSNSERRRHPSRLTAIADMSYRFRDHDKIPGDIKRLLSTSDIRPEHAHALMLDLYKNLPDEFAEAYRSLFHHLADGGLPLVFNCTAGKDRTGVAAALLLTALGVPRDIVLEDYLVTEQFFAQSCEMILNEKNMALFASVDRKIWEPLMRVHADYLNAMFEQLEHSHGSVERYIEERLGIGDREIERLRRNLLD